MTLVLALGLLSLAQQPARPTVRFGVVYHVPDSSADAIPGVYREGHFLPDNAWPAFPLHHPLRGTSTNRVVVQVMLDSSNYSERSDRGFAISQYRAHLTPPAHDSAETALFWYGPIHARILAIGPGRILPEVSVTLHSKAEELLERAV